MKRVKNNTIYQVMMLTLIIALISYYVEELSFEIFAFIALLVNLALLFYIQRRRKKFLKKLVRK